MTVPPQHPDPASAPQSAHSTFTNSGTNYGAQGAFYGSVQINHGPQVNLHALLHDHTGFLADRLASFVGRADELAEVQRRIAELLPTGGYVTITGQAGQGKSSLIAKLVGQALGERLGEDLPIAQLAERAGPTALAYHFIPFSPGPDHQVGLLRNLMARLIGKYGLSELYVATDSRPALRDYFARVLIEVAAKGGQEVIFIDGLDQIEEDASGVRDLSFLPTNPPAGIVFVLGTRPNDTLRPLELRKPQQQYWLPPLSRADFTLILQHRGVTLEAHLADRFYTVMEANALYLDLVARELAQAGALPAEQIIAQVADNPENLFSLAVERLKRPPLAWPEVIKPILGLLLVAREPLRLRAIRTLISQPDDAVQDGLERLGGLLQRDGEGRYTLFHLKLRDYLREDTAQPGKRYVFAADEEEQWHARLAGWAEEGGGLAAIWQDKVGDALEQERRAYARQHYITHLCLAKQWPRLWEVLDAGDYAAAKLRYDPSTRSVVLDLDLVRQQMVVATRGDYKAGVAWLPRLWQYSLLRGSLASQADNYARGLIPLLAEVGQTKEAIELTEVLTDEHKKIITLAQIGNVLFKQGQSKEAEQVYQRAKEVACLINDKNRRCLALEQIVASLVLGEQLGSALNMARSIEDSVWEAQALERVATGLVQAGHHEFALEVARSVKEGDSRAQVLRQVVHMLVVVGQVELARVGALDAVEAARLSERGDAHNKAMIWAIASLVTAGQLDRALEMARSMDEGDDRDKALEQVGFGLAVVGQRDLALEVALSIKKRDGPSWGLAKIAVILAAAGQTGLAMEVVHSIEGNFWRTLVQGQIAVTLVQLGQLEQALEIVRPIETGDGRDGVLGQIAVTLVQLGQLEQALEIVQSIETDNGRDGAVGQFAVTLVETGQLECALGMAQSIKDEGWRAQALTQVAVALAVSRQLEQTLEVVYLLEKGHRRNGALGQVTAALVRAGHLESALEVAQSIEAADERAQALVRVAEAYVLTKQLEFARMCVASAAATARVIEERGWHTWAWVQIAGALAMFRHLELALAVARSIKDGDGNAQALGQVTGALVSAEEGDLELGLEVARSIRDGDEKAQALGRVVAAHVQTGQLELALGIARSIKEAGWRADALGQVAAALVATRQLERALEIAQSIEWGRQRARALGQVAGALVEARRLELALVMAQLIEEGDERAQVLGKVAVTLAQLGRLKQARDVARSIKEEARRSEALGQIAATLVMTEQLEVALEIAQSIDDGFWRAEALRLVAGALVTIGQLELALEVARSIEEDDRRGDALGQIAAAFVPAKQLEVALDIVWSIEGEDRRAEGLGQVIAALARTGQQNKTRAVATEVLSNATFVSHSTRLNLLAQISRTISQIRNPAIALGFLHDHWSTLTRRDDLLALLPAAAPLIAAHPPLFQELLDGFEWVDQILTKW